MRNLVKFLRLAPSERRLLISAVLLLEAIRLALWSLPFPTSRWLLAKMKQRLSSRRLDAPSVARVVWAIYVASRYAPGTITCLPQAMATQLLLQWFGQPATIHIGVLKDKEELHAHAWVECNGKIVSGYSTASYTPFVHYSQTVP